MPAICESISIASKLNENLVSGFKKSDKENYENHQPTPTIKQVLTAKIEYEEAPSFTNTTLSTLQTKYILLKPNQHPINGKNFIKINFFHV